MFVMKIVSFLHCATAFNMTYKLLSSCDCSLQESCNVFHVGLPHYLVYQVVWRRPVHSR